MAEGEMQGRKMNGSSGAAAVQEDGLIPLKNSAVPLTGQMRWRRPWPALLLAAGLAAASAGCHNPLRNPLVATTIVNHQGTPVRLLEFDYPFASFGADSLAAGGEFRHSFAIEGSGPLTLHFMDAAGKNHTAKGPTVQGGEIGSLLVTIDGSGAVQWSLNVSGKK